MLLLEIFQKTTALKLSKNTDDRLEAKATIGGRELVFHANLVEGGAWEVIFLEPASEMPAGSGNHGNASEVMGCAVKFLRELISRKEPGKITFTASHVFRKRGNDWVMSTSRADLYDRMLARFKKEFDYDVTSVEDPHPHRHQRHFVLTKR